MAAQSEKKELPACPVETAQLRDMEEKGLVHRNVYAEVPQRMEYGLTELGQSLKPILDAILWARARRVGDITEALWGAGAGLAGAGSAGF